jgi:hypothetical protein
MTGVKEICVNGHTEWRIDEEREAIEGVRLLVLMLEQATDDLTLIRKFGGPWWQGEL